MRYIKIVFLFIFFCLSQSLCNAQNLVPIRCEPSAVAASRKLRKNHRYTDKKRIQSKIRRYRKVLKRLKGKGRQKRERRNAFRAVIKELRQVKKNVTVFCNSIGSEPVPENSYNIVTLRNGFHTLSKTVDNTCLELVGKSLEIKRCTLGAFQQFSILETNLSASIKETKIQSRIGKRCFTLKQNQLFGSYEETTCNQQLVESDRPIEKPQNTFIPTIIPTKTATPTSTFTLLPSVVPTQTPTPTVTPTATPTKYPVHLPVEVMGNDITIETLKFEIENDYKVSSLYFQCHRCAYKDASVANPQKAKVSISVNHGKWIEVMDSTVAVYEPEKTFGGLAGGFYTVRFIIPAKNLNTGINEVSFRFNGTDGKTMGFRVTDFDLIDDKGERFLSDARVFDSPEKWKGTYRKEDIEAGHSLWHKADYLQESPVTNKRLKASCNDCHVEGGRDLKYFNYSPKSISARSKFHGLSNKEAYQLAVYILSTDTPHSKYARPWNPPYQPVKGIDKRPVYEWAAGGGLESVASHDAETIYSLFPNGTSSQRLQEVIDTKKTLNVREVPTVLQFPDWNAWLPEEHPKDLYGTAFYESEIHPQYIQLKSSLSENYKNYSAEDFNTLFKSLRSTYLRFMPMGGPQPCLKYKDLSKLNDKYKDPLSFLRNDATCEDFASNLNKLHSVKVWEFMHTHQLEDKAPDLYRYGEKRGWLGMSRSVFEIASHRSANNSKYHTWQSEKLGAYHSNVWYHLQLVLSGGGYREGSRFQPQDWFYTPNWLTSNAIKNNADLGGLRLVTMLKMYQVLDTPGHDGKGSPLSYTRSGGWWLPFTHLWRIQSGSNKVSNNGEPWTSLNSYRKNLHADVAAQFIREFLKIVEQTPVSDLPRESAEGKNAGAFDNVSTNPIQPIDKDHYYSRSNEKLHARDFWRAIVKFKEMNIPKKELNKLIEWCSRVWTNADWESLKE